MTGLGDLKKKKRDQDSDDWHLTLADMMILLLCFFVVIVSVSAVDVERYKLIADSLQKTMGGQEKKQKEEPRKEQLDLAELYENLQQILGESAREVDLEWRRDGVAVNLPGETFFDKGSAALTDRAGIVLTEMSPSLLAIPYRLTIEGHSDSTPIHSMQFPSNWELSSARAGSVARFLIDQGFPRNRVEILGLADTRPLAPNEDSEGRPLPENQAKNRRVAIVVRR